MAIWRCDLCGRPLSIGRGPAGETHGVCELCDVRIECDAALAHALVGLRAIADELERARAGIWKPLKEES